VEDKQLRFFGAKEEKEKVKKGNTSTSSPVYATKKDVFFMSFLAFMLVGLVFTGIFFATGTITGNAIFDLSGEEEGDANLVPESETVEETTEEAVENTTEETTEEAVENTKEETIEETTEEAVEEESSDLCNKDIEIDVGESYDFDGKDIAVKLVSGSSTQLSVNGKLRLISVTDEQEINGLKISLEDTKTDSVVIQVIC
jgi:hypothetical protein